jgi:cytochrome c biogenesis protein CcmG, thiol:disulfide interchange protein DsbE
VLAVLSSLRAIRVWPLLLLLPAACSGPPQARLGSPAPDFTLQNIDGTSVRLSDFKGKPILINFWATWCVPCREEMPLLQATYEQYREQGLVILAIDLEEDASLVRRWVEQGGYTFTFLLDSDGELLKRYNVTAAPTSYFLMLRSAIRVRITRRCRPIVPHRTDSRQFVHRY